MSYDLQTQLKPILKELGQKLYNFHHDTYIVESVISRNLRPKDFFYRIVNFGNDTITAANQGGGFACQHSAAGETPRPIEIYDNNLNHILSIFTPKEYGSLNAFYYSPEELIVCLFTNKVCVFNQRGQLVDHVKLFTPEDNEFFEFASFYEYGFFIVTNKGNVYYVNSYLTFSCEKFAHFPIENYDTISTSGSAVLPADTRVYIDGMSTGYAPMLWISASKGQTNSLLCVQKDNVQILSFPLRVLSMKYSPDYSRVAVIGADQLLIFNKNFTENQACFNIPEIGLARISWCGNSSLLIAGHENMTMIGCCDDVVNIPIPGDFAILPEIDGARIVTRDDVFYIRKIDGTPLDLVRRNKSNPALKLIFDLSQKLTTAQDDPTKFVPELGKSVDGCLDAVAFFRNTSITHLLLNLVIRCKQNIENFDFQKFSNIVVNKRITEQLSRSPVLMPLTVAQYQALGPDHLLQRLCNRYQHCVAYRVADYLNVNYEPLYNNWAHSLIFSSASNAEIVAALKASDHAFDYVQLATAAYKRSTGTPEVNLALAKALIDMNGVKARSLPLLIMWKQWDMAINAAVESNDTSLLMYTLKVVQEEINKKPAPSSSQQLPATTSSVKSSNPFKKITAPSTSNNSADVDNLKKKINQVLLDNPIALESWILLNPDDPNISELVAKSKIEGSKKVAVNREFMQILRKNFDFGAAPQDVINDAANLKKKASKLSDSFGQKYVQRLVDMCQACKDLKIQSVKTPLEALDEVIKKGGNLKDAKKKLQVSDLEILIRKLEIGYQRIDKGESDQLFKKTVLEFETNDLIDYLNEVFRQRRDELAWAIKSNANKPEVNTAYDEFSKQYQIHSY